MTLKVTTIRLPDEALDELQKLTEELKKDRSDLLREAVEIGIEELKIRHALDLYTRGSISFGKLSELTGISHWELYDELKKRGIHYRYGEERFEEEIRRLTR